MSEPAAEVTIADLGTDIHIQFLATRLLVTRLAAAHSLKAGETKQGGLSKE